MAAVNPQVPAAVDVGRPAHALAVGLPLVDFEFRVSELKGKEAAVTLLHTPSGKTYYGEEELFHSFKGGDVH